MSATLFDLIEREEIDALRRLLAGDAQASQARHAATGLGAITFALYHRRFAAARILAAARLQLDWAEACGLGEIARLELLLEQEPEILSSHTADGFTPLHLACFFGRAPLVTMLVARGAQVDALAAGASQLRPLHSAVAGRDLATVEALLAARPDVHARQSRGFVALHAAALNGDVAIVRALLAAGADAKARADDGKCALDFARERRHAPVEELLAP